MFLGKDNVDQLVKITNFLGTQDLYAYIDKYKIKLDPNEFSSLTPKTRKEWSSYVNNENAHLCPPEALNLLSKMLIYDHVSSA